MFSDIDNGTNLISSEEDTARYKVIFLVSTTLLSLYTPLMIFVLCKVKCHVKTNAILIMCSFLITFFTKTVSDGLRLYST